MNKSLPILALVCAAQVSQILAWNSETHLMIARKAQDILQKTNPSALQKSEELLRKFTDYSSKNHEDKYPFVECVTWPDDIKRIGGGWQSAWHFDDQPIFGDKTPHSQLQIETTLKNITTVMPQLYEWLKGNPDTSSLAYTTVMAHAKSEEEGRSQALRLLIHYYGDVHQPLHIANRYTAEHTGGDRGGNDFPLKYHYTANELHAVWDTVVYNNHKSIKRPFTEATFGTFTDMTNDFMSGVTVPASLYQTLDFAKFRDESSAIAQHVYDDITEGKDQVLPDSYVQKYQPIAKRRVVLAAHRLAYGIGELFGSSSSLESAAQEEEAATFLN